MLQNNVTSSKDQELNRLSEAEVLARRAQGLGNQVPHQSTRSYRQILRENVFTFINLVLIGLGIALVALGRTSDAMVSVGVILVNVVVNVIQEVRAKRILDHIALITRPTATVLRDGVRKKVDPGEVVCGDLLMVEPGDQFVVDGSLVGDGRIEVDESLLTGESHPMVKQAGAPVYSGSFCVLGSAYYQAEKAGPDSLSAHMAAGARAFRRVQTPLQKQVNLVVRVLLLVASYFELLYIVNAVIERHPLVDTVQLSVVILGLVPNGLFLAIATAYTLGAVRIARKGALVQQANAIESLSNVNLICLDKTGTLTTNRIYFNALRPYQVAEADLRRRLGDFAANLSTRNSTAAAIAAECPGQPRQVTAEVSFSSEYKWSALALAPVSSNNSGEIGSDASDLGGVYILGAPEILGPHLSKEFVLAGKPAGKPNPEDTGQTSETLDGSALDLTALTQDWTARGLRVVAFAISPHELPSPDAAGQPCLPGDLHLLGLISLGDELRPGARQTLEAFHKAGVQLKIISGDNPETVAALARQAGFAPVASTGDDTGYGTGDKPGAGAPLAPVSGLDLAQMDAAQREKTIEQSAIFGRVTPQQKAEMVKLLRDRGHYVAMIGDGVNDVLSLKQANLAIALQSGSQASRSVADLILFDNSFTVLPEVLNEGQRILTGMQDVLKLFLTRILYVVLLVLSTGFVGSFPLSPKNSSILVLLTVGIPTIALAFWAKPGLVSPKSLTRQVIRFILPAGLTLSLAGLFIFIGYLLIPPLLSGSLVVGPTGDLVVTRRILADAQTAVTTFSVFCGLLLLPFVEPPSHAWVGGEPLSGDRRPSYLAFGLLLVYLVILVTPGLRHFFELLPLRWWNYLILGAAAGLWGWALRQVWRSRILERFLSVDFTLE